MIHNFYFILPLIVGTLFGNILGISQPSFLKDSVVTLNRTRLCPANEGRPETLWELFDNKTGKCYQPRSRGPCGAQYTLFYQISNSEYGQCECGFEKYPTKHLNRPVALSSEDASCYPLYDKANCKDGEWFVLKMDDSYSSEYDSYKGICEKNPCLELQSKASSNESIDELTIMKFLGFEYYTSRDDFKCSDLVHPYGDIHPIDLNKPFWFFNDEDGKCYRTFSQGPCKQGGLVIFEGTEINPGCFHLSARTIFLMPLSKEESSDEETTDFAGSNEELESTSNGSSSKLCPENEERDLPESKWELYENATGKCDPPYGQGPCNGTFRYWAQQASGSEIGICRNISPLNTFSKLNRPVAQSAKDGEVYLVYSKGNCNDGEWFVFNDKFEGVCTKNPCLNNREIEWGDVEVNTMDLIKYLGYEYYDSYESFRQSDIDEFPHGHPLDIHKPFWFLHGRQCHKYFSRGPCAQGEVLVFKGLNPTPTCYNPSLKYGPVDHLKKHRPTPSRPNLAETDIDSQGLYPVGSGGVTGTGDQKCDGITHGSKCLPKLNKLQFS